MFFTSYVWGCRHAGMNGQRVTTAVSTIHRSMSSLKSCSHKSTGCDKNCGHLTIPETDLDIEPFNTLNYSDDFAGAEVGLPRSTLAFNLMGSLLAELDLTESFIKALSPREIMIYLGLEFDSIKLEITHFCETTHVVHY